MQWDRTRNHVILKQAYYHRVAPAMSAIYSIDLSFAGRLYYGGCKQTDAGREVVVGGKQQDAHYACTHTLTTDIFHFPLTKSMYEVLDSPAQSLKTLAQVATRWEHGTK